jgi:hypothetical protein
MPWKGKAFDPARREGINILSRDSLALAHLVWPLYRDYRGIALHFYGLSPSSPTTHRV